MAAKRKNKAMASTPFPESSLSFRPELSDTLGDFLRDEGCPCADTASALCAIGGALAHHREEGVTLFPEVYLCRDIREIVRITQGEFVKVGTGDRSDQVGLRILKECAPLAIGGWAVYIERLDRSFAYGVFRASNVPLAPTPYEILVGQGGRDILAVCLRRTIENVVEVAGWSGRRLVIHFGGDRHDSATPRDSIGRLSEAICSHVPSGVREAVLGHTTRCLARILRKPHGALAVVLGHKQEVFPEELADVKRLEVAVSIVERVRDYQRASGEGDSVERDTMLTRLQATSALLEGMFGSDGIVVFRADGTILGYRAFMRLRREKKPVSDSGGSRRRTFDALKGLVDRKRIAAAFFLSQDGHEEFYEVQR